MSGKHLGRLHITLIIAEKPFMCLITVTTGKNGWHNTKILALVWNQLWYLLGSKLSALHKCWNKTVRSKGSPFLFALFVMPCFTATALLFNELRAVNHISHVYLHFYHSVAKCAGQLPNILARFNHTLPNTTLAFMLYKTAAQHQNWTIPFYIFDTLSTNTVASQLRMTV